MAENYCGKSCASCSHKEALNCPGCKAGPGSRYGGDCALAKCCAGKGHQECTTCEFTGNCGLYRGRERVPEYRLKSVEAERFRKESLAKRAPVLGKWLWLLFWLVIPNAVASIITQDAVTAAFPAILLPGQILCAACSCVYGVILIWMASEEGRYRTAGICFLVSAAVNVLIACASGGGEVQTWTLLVTIPAAIVVLIGQYKEFTAHSIILSDVNTALSIKWKQLWRWNVGTSCVFFGSVLLVMISPILGLTVMVLSGIGLAVVSILKLVYLYQTAQFFRSKS